MPLPAKCLLSKDSIKKRKSPANYILTTRYLEVRFLSSPRYSLTVFVVDFFLHQSPCSIRIYICNFSTSPLAHTTGKVPHHYLQCSRPVIRSDRSDGYDGSIQCPASVGALCPLYLCVPSPSIRTTLRGVSILAPLYHLPPSGVSMPAISSNVTPPHMHFSFWARLPSQQARQLQLYGSRKETKCQRWNLSLPSLPAAV